MKVEEDTGIQIFRFPTIKTGGGGGGGRGRGWREGGESPRSLLGGIGGIRPLNPRAEKQLTTGSAFTWLRGKRKECTVFEITPRGGRGTCIGASV